MKSNTEGWSNDHLNERIEELEDAFEAIEAWIEKCPKPGEGGLEELEQILRSVAVT